MLSGDMPIDFKTSVSAIWTAVMPTKQFNTLLNMSLSSSVKILTMSIPFVSRTWLHL